ncbi:2'-5' RNA ligase family protein [Streptomyces sp. NPDC046887]|uniref:2'-5' RNA ligase family protein n=1 Tax=Streptomyces sp. NPDC046887 TaxID=3155472 RepID=UPI0033FB61FC
MPVADAVVGGQRMRFDEPARAGLPAHVTVLYPFLPVERIGAGTLDALRALVSRHEGFEVVFGGFGRFPDALWLAPEPAEPLRALTEAISGRWPEAPPYEGRFAEVVPHLTVASGQSSEVYAAVEGELGAGLPFAARVEELQLMVSDGTRWHERAVFRLG